MRPRFTDLHRFPNGTYTPAKESEKPNYLRNKFNRIRAEMTRQTQDATVTPMKKRKFA